MKARLIFNRRISLATNAFVELVLWRVPHPVRGSAHLYKYSLAHVVDGVCVLRYDNEAGIRDHRHIGDTEFPLDFSGPDELLAELLRDVRRSNDENGDS